MPLKHTTETTLVAVLGIAMALAGVVVAVLSLVTSPWMLWIAAFFISLAYPLILYPHFQDRRADYEFRLLHFVPAFILLLWLALTVLLPSLPILAVVRGFLTFAWALPLVLLGFLLLAWFCLHVIRQRGQRLALLTLVFIPFAALAFFGNTLEWNRQLAAVLDRQETGSGSVAASSSRGPVAVASARSGVSVMSRGMSRSSARSLSISSKAPALPDAGGGIEFFAFIVPAATCAATQVKTMRRARA